jgi:acyl-CoA thioesterase YciA
MSSSDNALPKDKIPAIRVLAMPADTNAAGDIFGGWLMSHVDIAGSIDAIRYANGRVATVAINSFEFIKPVYVGDLVSIYTEIHKVGNTSIQIAVTAYAERERKTTECVRVVKALLTYVAIDENRRPRPIKNKQLL